MSPFADMYDAIHIRNGHSRTSLIMNPITNPAPFLVLLLHACSTAPTPGPGLAPTKNMENGSFASVPDISHVLITQRTRALYVALRSHAWNEPVAFGSDLEDNVVHWNMCPGGTMVACAVTPTANGDTIVTGIPWLHGTVEDR